MIRVMTLVISMTMVLVVMAIAVMNTTVIITYIFFNIT